MSGVKGRSGRKKKTDAEKLILGAKKDRIGLNAPDVISDHVLKLKWIEDESRKEANALFEYFEPMLFNNGTLSASDAIAYNALFEIYQKWYNAKLKCDSFGRYSISKKQNEDGSFTVSSTLHAWAKDESECLSHLISACREFGLTPVSRSSVEKITRGEKVNPFKGIT